jgi:hypothetical protein
MELSPRVKKILLSIVFALAVLAVGYLLYVVFFRAPQSAVNQTATNQPTNQTGQLPNINQAQNGNQNRPTNQSGQLPAVDTIARGGDTQGTVLTPNTATAAPTIGRDGTTRFYNSGDGKFYRLDAAGRLVQIGSAVFINSTSVTWAPTTNETVVEFPDGSNIYLNLDTNKQTTLPKEYEDFSFSPQSDQIAFKYMTADVNHRVLAVSKPDGTSARSLETLGENGDKVTVDWSPTGKVAAHYTDFVDLNTQEVGFVGLNKENLPGIRLSGSRLRTIYSPDGKRMLYSTDSSATDNKPVLGIVDADGQNIGKNNRSLNVSTFADKCTFAPDGDTVYCAVPSEQKFGYGLEPGILENVPDDLYKIDLNSGIASKIATPVNDRGQAVYQVSNLLVTKDASQLIFRDAVSGQLVKIDLR